MGIDGFELRITERSSGTLEVEARFSRHQRLLAEMVVVFSNCMQTDTQLVMSQSGQKEASAETWGRRSLSWGHGENPRLPDTICTCMSFLLIRCYKLYTSILTKLSVLRLWAILSIRHCTDHHGPHFSLLPRYGCCMWSSQKNLLDRGSRNTV